MRHKTPWYSLATPIIKKARSILHPEPKLPWEAQVFRQAHSFIDPLQLNNRFNDSWNKYHKEDYNLRNELKVCKEQEANKYRKAIASSSIYPNIYGVYREGFNRYDNDRLAMNPTYALCEKSSQDYVSTLEWTVKNRDKNKVPDAIDFLEYPNKQDTLNDILGETCRDVIRYDAGVWAKTLDQKDELIDFKAYYGPEFWIGIDRNLQSVKTEAGTIEGWWSHGYAEKYWQHSRQGIFLEFEPDEISYFMMYPRSDSPYGTDFIMHLRWYLEMLLDSTKAAGMMFANGINPGTVWRHPALSSSQELEERKTEIELSLQGPENFGSILHLIGEEELKQLTPTMVDMQWLQGQKFISEIVWAMFGFSPADFGSGDMNRATAYIQTNVTKSRMLFPLITLFQTRINRDILPFLPGYEKGWKFEFIPSVSLDDDQKRAGIKQTRAGTFATMLQTGVPADLAAKFSEITDDLSPDDIKRLKDTQQQQSYQQDPDEYPDGAGMESDPENYDGTDTSLAMQQVSQPIQKASKQQRLDIFLHFDASPEMDTIQKSRGFYGHKGRPAKRGRSLPRHAAKNPSNITVQTLNPDLFKLENSVTKLLKRDTSVDGAEQIIKREMTKLGIDPNSLEWNVSYDVDELGHKYPVINFDIGDSVPVDEEAMN